MSFTLRGLNAIREGFVIVISPFTVRLRFRISNYIWNFGKSRPLRASSDVFGCTRRIFLFFVTIELPCHLVMCERASDYSRRFVKVTTCQLQLQLLLNQSVNNTYVRRDYWTVSHELNTRNGVMDCSLSPWSSVSESLLNIKQLFFIYLHWCTFFKIVFWNIWHPLSITSFLLQHIGIYYKSSHA